MGKPLIDIREGRVATVFWEGNVYKLEPDSESGCRCQQKTEHGLRSVVGSVKKLMEWIYKNPEAPKKVNRFPRLPERAEVLARKTHIDDLRDIPPTSEFEGQAIRWLVDGIIPES